MPGQRKGNPKKRSSSCSQSFGPTVATAMMALEFCVLDETDSGLDIDALQTVAKGIIA